MMTFVRSLRSAANPGAFFLCLAVCASAAGHRDTPGNRLWEELSGKRARLSSLHQEFQVTRTFRTTRGEQSSKTKLTIDIADERWRQETVSGSGTYLKIFDGKQEFSAEEGSEEYVRTKPSVKGVQPMPEPYSLPFADWSKAVQRGMRSCRLAKVEHECVLVDVPITSWTRVSSESAITRGLGGTWRLFVDTQDGAVLSSRTTQTIDTGRASYVQDVTYKLEQMSYGAPANPATFQLPASYTKEVKELPRWDAARIRKQLGGKPAPDLNVTDLRGNPVTLSALRGQTVLLDFWATWCGPCREDGPALDELYRKYRNKGLTIVGISVSEDRSTVEKFLVAHPHDYPIVLTTENEMPPAYRIGEFPTYVVIDASGNVSAALSGEKGFPEIRKVLKKAGLDSE